MNQQADEEKRDHKHLWKVENLTELQKKKRVIKVYCNWIVLGFLLIYCYKVLGTGTCLNNHITEAY